MLKLDITFTFLSPWHMGSGFGEGANLDAVPVKSPGGLPYIPGKSVKGLFREAVMLAEEHKQVPSGTICRLFGSRDVTLSRYDSTAGILRFSSATLGDAMEAWASILDETGNESKKKTKINEAAVRELFTPLASTRIDQDGLADDNTLRKIEVALPVALTATVEAVGEKSDIVDSLTIAAALIRQAGTHRHRGLGRVVVSVKEVQS